MAGYSIRAKTDGDREWVRELMVERWGSDLMVMHGIAVQISELPGLVAESGQQVVGYASYRIEGTECELTSLDSLREGLGIGSALIEAVKSAAAQAGCERLFLITTNDNTAALRFYQRRGFVLAALRRDAVTEARKIKPEIPWVGEDGIPIRDELELEFLLGVL